MNQIPELPVFDAEMTLADRARLFYLGAAVFLLIMMLLGFQQFFINGKAYPNREIAAPVHNLVVLHGVAMTAWVLLFLIQCLLITCGNPQVHRLMGNFGAVLAAGIFVIGLKVAVAAIGVSPPGLLIWSLTPKQFLAVPIFNMLIFAFFVIAGIAHRRRAAVHRPMMLLSMLAVYSAAISRIDAISDLYRGTIFETLLGPFFSTLIAGSMFIFINRLMTRSLDRVYTTGFIGLAVADFLIIRLAKTDGWDQFAGFLLD